MKNKYKLFGLIIFLAFSFLIFSPGNAKAVFVIGPCADVCGGGGGGPALNDFYYNGSCDNHNILSGSPNDPEGLAVLSYHLKAGATQPTRVTNSNANNNYWLKVSTTNTTTAKGYTFQDGVVGVKMPFSPTGGITWSGQNGNNSYFDPIGLATNAPSAFNTGGGLNCAQTYGSATWNQTYYAHDFVFQPNFGWTLFCGFSENLPVNFTLSIYNNSNPYGDNTGGYWVLTPDTPSTFASKGASSYTNNNYFTFNYNTLNSASGQKFANGFSNVVYAYYIEPGYKMATTSSYTPTNKFANIGDTVTFNLSSGVSDKYNILNNFSYTNSVSETLFPADGGALPIPLSSTTQTIINSFNDPKTISTYWTGSVPVLIKSSYTYNGSYVNLTNGDQICITVSAGPQSNAPYLADVSKSTSCVTISISSGSVTLSCSDSYQDSPSNKTISYSIANNTNIPITVGSGGWSISETITGGSFNQNTPNSNWPFGAPSTSSYPPPISPGGFGTGSFYWTVDSANGYPSLLSTYTVNLSLNGPDGLQSNATCKSYVVIRPYFKVYGAGIMTGSSFSGTGSCSSDSSPGDIVAFNNGTNGSSTDQQIFANGYVYQMGSQQNSTLSGTNLLTFANTPSDLFGTNGAIGGRFDGLSCMPDYFTNIINGITSSTTNVNIVDSIGYDQMRVIAPQIVDINGVQLITKLNELLTTTTAGSYPTTNNSQNVILSNSSYGDIYISGDILMPSTVSASGKYPYLYIITKGADIYINRNVKEVDAVLIAEPDSKGNGGNIYTCDSTSPKATDFGPGGCNTPLTIKGALLAKRVNLLRSSLTYTGSILNNVDGSSESAKNSTGCEDPSTFKGGEQICFSPLIWLNDPFTPTSLTSLDYLQNLPATL